MRPLTVITGILLGTAASIAIGLWLVVLIALVLADEAPQLAAELEQLWRYALAFLALTAACAAGFIGLLQHRPWRWWAQAVMWAAVAVTVAAFWPE